MADVGGEDGVVQRASVEPGGELAARRRVGAACVARDAHPPDHVVERHGPVLPSTRFAPEAVEWLGRVAQRVRVDRGSSRGAEAVERREAETLFAIERQRVLDTYLGTPLRDNLNCVRVDQGELFIDLPAPVDRAYLRIGVSVTDIENAVPSVTAASSAWWGSWVVDEIVLRDYYLEASLDPTGKFVSRFIVQGARQRRAWGTQTIEDILGVPVR